MKIIIRGLLLSLFNRVSAHRFLLYADDPHDSSPSRPWNKQRRSVLRLLSFPTLWRSSSWTISSLLLSKQNKGVSSVYCKHLFIQIVCVSIYPNCLFRRATFALLRMLAIVCWGGSVRYHLCRNILYILQRIPYNCEILSLSYFILPNHTKFCH